MKILSTALLAAGLVALSGCGGGNNAANNVAADTYNVVPDETGNELGLGNDTGLGNETVLDNGTVNLDADTNAATGNSAGNTQ